MKHYLVFILVLVSNAIFACGFYPYGEDLRFSFFDPLNFRYYTYSDFNYSSNSFSISEKPVSETNRIDANEKLWVEYCKNKVSFEEVRTVLLQFKSEDITEKNSNKMLRYLYKTKDMEAVNYLKFAKNCEFFNGFYDDPWERQEVNSLPKRENLINQAVSLSNKVKNEVLKQRYTFLAIRLSYYNGDKEKIISLYDRVFDSQKKDNILKYWSLYFKVTAEKNNALSNFYAAQVFVNAPDKNFMTAGMFNRKVPLDSVLMYAKTKQEKANVYFLAGIKKSDRSLDYIKELYKYNPKFDGLSFLLLREINKIEDWILTPYYSLFNPSIESNYDNESMSTKEILKRVEKDRVYAGQLLDFVNNVDLKKAHDPLLWKMSKAYLLFLTKNNKGCLNQISELEKNLSKNDSLYNQIEIIKALALTANQSSGKAIVLDQVKPILLKNESSKKFVFAIGRELEYKGNTTDAAFLYSKLTEDAADYNYNNQAFWKGSKNKRSYYSDYFSNYFDYINMFYTPNQVEKIVDEIKKSKNDLDRFSVWKHSFMKNEMPGLYDLIGTKYIRQNKLEKALFYFGNDGDQTEHAISDSECKWERGNCYYAYKNPFLVLKYTPDFMPQKGYYNLNKYAVTYNLISYLKKASNPAEKNKDYYNFLVANCYYNMTFYGSIKEMRRYGWNIYIQDYPIEDNDEFYECNLAKKYYDLAFKYAKTDMFKALCLRMMGKCEKNKLLHQYPNDYNHEIENYDDFLWSKNKYYQDLKSNYADNYEELISDCNAFEEYFKARR